MNSKVTLLRIGSSNLSMPLANQMANEDYLKPWTYLQSLVTRARPTSTEQDS